MSETNLTPLQISLLGQIINTAQLLVDQFADAAQDRNSDMYIVSMAAAMIRLNAQSVMLNRDLFQKTLQETIEAIAVPPQDTTP